MLKIQSTLTKISSLEDRSFKVTMTTQELSDEQGSELIKLNGRFGFLLFSETPVQDTDVPEFSPDMVDSKKSPSERLRGVMYLNWKENSDQKTDFNQVYLSQMEKLINFYKEKLS